MFDKVYVLDNLVHLVIKVYGSIQVVEKELAAHTIHCFSICFATKKFLFFADRFVIVKVILQIFTIKCA